MKSKTILTVFAALGLLVITPASVAQKKNSKSPSRPEDTMESKIAVVEGFASSIVGWKAGDKAATLAKVAVGLWKREPERARTLLQTALDLSDSSTDTNNDPKKLVVLRRQVLAQVFLVDRTWHAELIEAVKAEGSPYSGTIDELMRLEEYKQAVELIDQSLDKGFREDLIRPLHRLRQDPAMAAIADGLFRKMVAAGSSNPAEVMSWASYPGQVGGFIQFPNGLEVPNIKADKWGDLPPETITLILTTALKARSEDKERTYVMCKLLLPKAERYAPALSVEFENCMNNYRSSETKAIDAMLDSMLSGSETIASMDVQLEYTDGVKDPRERESRFAVLAIRSLTAGKLEDASKAINRLDTTTGIGKQLAELLEFASAGKALGVNPPNITAVEKVARKLSGAKAAALWLATARVRKKEGDLEQARRNLAEAAKLAEGIEDGQGPYFLLNAARQVAESNDKLSRIDPITGWSYLASAVKAFKKNDPTKPVYLVERVSIPNVIMSTFGYSKLAPVDLDMNKNLLTFLMLDRDRTMAEVNKLDEMLLTKIYPYFAKELLR